MTIEIGKGKEAATGAPRATAPILCEGVGCPRTLPSVSSHLCLECRAKIATEFGCEDGAAVLVNLAVKCRPIYAERVEALANLPVRAQVRILALAASAEAQLLGITVEEQRWAAACRKRWPLLGWTPVRREGDEGWVA